jgi:hypothetical protein
MLGAIAIRDASVELTVDSVDYSLKIESLTVTPIFPTKKIRRVIEDF